MMFMLRLLVPLFLVWCTHSALGAVLNLGVIIPNSTVGASNRIILDAAIAKINTERPIPGYTLSLIYMDSNGEPRSAALSAMNLLQNNVVVGIIGDTYSTTSISIAPIAEHYQVPLISPSASSVELSNRAIYPYFLRTIPNDDVQTRTMVSMIETIGWEKVAIIVTDDVYGAQALISFRNASAGHLTILDEQTFDARASNVSAQVRAIASSGAKIIVMYAIPTAAVTVLHEADAQGLLTKDYAWIGSDGVMLVKGQQLGADLSAKMQGTIGTKPFATGTGSAYTDYVQIMQNNNVPVGEYNIALFDIPLVYAEALRRMLVDGADVQNGTLLLSYLRTTPDSVVGASGAISFDGNDRKKFDVTDWDLWPVPFDIMNWRTIASTQFESAGRWQPGEVLPAIMYSGNSSNPPTDDPNANIVKLGIFVLANADRGSTRWAITKVAIDDFNSRGIIPNITLLPITFRQTTTARAILDTSAMAAQGVVGVIGPTASDISTTVASMLGVLTVPQISFSATSPVLSNKVQYPYFLRTVASDDWQVNVFVEVVKAFRWNRVGFLSTVESYGSDGFQQFLSLANKNGIQVVSATFQTDSTSLASQMKYLQDSKIKIIITMVSLNYCGFLYREIFKSSLYGAGYAWIHSDTCSQASLTSFVDSANVPSMPGMLGIQPFKGEGVSYNNITEHIADLNVTYEGYTTTVDKIRADPYATYNYDAAFAFGYAIKQCKEIYPRAEALLGPNLLGCLKNLTFTGYSGPVSFTDAGDRLVAYSIVNWQKEPNRFVPVGRFDPVTSNFSIGGVEWLGGASNPPNLDESGSINGLALGLAVGLGVAGLVIIVIGILLYRFSKRKRAIKFIEAVPWDDSEFSLNDTLDSSSEGVDTSLAVSKTKLDFGLKDKDRFPVDKKMIDTVQITNNTNGLMNFKIYSPLANHRFLCKIYPGEGVLKKGQTMQINIECTLLCTSDLEHLIKLTYNDSKTMAHSQYLHIVFEGDISDKLDPDELELKESLGKGAFGTVYRGIYRGREVAIKTMNTQSEWIPADVVEFNKELELMRRLKHLNVVTFVACSLVPNKMCLVTEFCKYGSLSKFMKQYPDMPLGFRLRIALDVAEGVNFLHSNGVLHRDIKPDNVLLVSKNAESNVVAKITDFGTARTVNAQRNQAFNHTAGMGTPIYMAPEILKKQPYNNKVDVFSYGLFLWELISNEEPYNFIDMPWDIPRYVISGKRCPIPQGTPIDIENLIKACWANDPVTRPTFAEIIVTLTSLFKMYHQSSDDTFTSPSSRFSASGSFVGKGKENEEKMEKERSKEKLNKENEKEKKKQKESKKKGRRPSAMISIEMDAVSLDNPENKE